MQVILCSILRSEWLVTQITLVWKFPSAYTFTSLQVTPFREWSVTHFTGKGCSPVCTCWCFFRVPWSVNDLLYTLHAYGHSPVCSRWCIFRLPCSVNDYCTDIWKFSCIFHEYHKSSISSCEISLTMNFTQKWTINVKSKDRYLFTSHLNAWFSPQLFS